MPGLVEAIPSFTNKDLNDPFGFSWSYNQGKMKSEGWELKVLIFSLLIGKKEKDCFGQSSKSWQVTIIK